MRCLEIFAGAGGAALGLHRAGLEHLALVEWDHDAAEVLRAAIAAGLLDGEVLEGDVRAVDWTRYAGNVDVLWCSPPCQSASMAGKRLGAKDERNGWPWTFDVIDALRPTWVLTENVPGTLLHSGAAHEDDPLQRRSDPLGCPGCYTRAEILPAFGRRFASVQHGIIDASDHGVPQRRARWFVVAGPTAIGWPEPTHSQEALVAAKWLDGSYWVGHGIAPVGEPSDAERAILDRLRQGGLFGAPPALRLARWRTVRDAIQLGVPTLYAETERESGAFNAAYHVRGGGGNPRRAAAEHERTERDLTDEPATTVSAHEAGNGGLWMVDPKHLSDQRASDALFLATGRRRLTPSECAALQGYPPDYPWHASRTATATYRMVGNSCCPALAEAIARAVLEAG